jgi:acyl-CoA synthetase (NDP forming)
VSQLSFFSAESVPPAVTDLTGVLAAAGQVVTVGDGGKYVEALADVQVLMADASRQEIQQALRRLRIAPLLDGVRGEPACDVEALCDAVMAAGRLIADSEAGVQSLDLNPVIVRAAGQGCAAADAVIFRATR